MMEQLGIEAWRPGASGDENDPDHANYDELLANPYPTLPDPLTLDDGGTVKSADVGLMGSSGRGGAALLRRNFGETLENLTGSGEYHWMAGNFLRYGAAKAAFGPRNPGDLPVDSHELIALCAPRLVFVSYGIPAMGDAGWVDQRGAFMAAVAASPIPRHRRPASGRSSRRSPGPRRRCR